MKLTAHATVHIYPVGMFSKIRLAYRAARHGRYRFAVKALRVELDYLAQKIRAREWRAVKNSFNGYLAEPREWPTDGSLRRCGSGWTRKRAMRSLRRHGYREAQP